jgi:hypothetical protein
MQAATSDDKENRALQVAPSEGKDSSCSSCSSEPAGPKKSSVWGASGGRVWRLGRRVMRKKDREPLTRDSSGLENSPSTRTRKSSITSTATATVSNISVVRVFDEEENKEIDERNDEDEDHMEESNDEEEDEEEGDHLSPVLNVTRYRADSPELSLTRRRIDSPELSLTRRRTDSPELSLTRRRIDSPELSLTRRRQTDNITPPFPRHQRSKDDMWAGVSRSRGKVENLSFSFTSKTGVSGLRQISKDDLSLLPEKRGPLGSNAHAERIKENNKETTQERRHSLSMWSLPRGIHAALRVISNLPSTFPQLGPRRIFCSDTLPPTLSHVDSDRLFDLLQMLSWTFSFNIDLLTRMSERLSRDASKISTDYLKCKMMTYFSVKIGDYEAENIIQWALLHNWAASHRLRAQLARQPFSLLLPHDMTKAQWCFRVDTLAISRGKELEENQNIENLNSKVNDNITTKPPPIRFPRIKKSDRAKFKKIVKKCRRKAFVQAEVPANRTEEDTLKQQQQGERQSLYFHSNLQNSVEDSRRERQPTPRPLFS